MQLYLVKTHALPNSRYGSFYVVADNTGQAYTQVREFLDDHNLCFGKERGLDSVTLLADEGPYADIGRILFICPSIPEEEGAK